MADVEDGNAANHKIAVSNLSPPLILDDVNFAGIAMSRPDAVGQVNISTAHATTSLDPLFHLHADGLLSALSFVLRQNQHNVNLMTANSVLLVISRDKKAKLWVNSAAVALKVLIRAGSGKMQAGSIISENQLADISALSFPAIEIQSTDQVLYLFREGWHFGLLYDFRDNIVPQDLHAELGRLYRKLKYRHLYDLVADQMRLENLISTGWFPFAEIIGSNFERLTGNFTEDHPMEAAENELLSKFDEKRLIQISERWKTKEILQAKSTILDEAIQAYLAGMYISTIKIILTEIEDVLFQAFKLTHGSGTSKIQKLIRHMQQAAEKKGGDPASLLLPTAFETYLTNYTFKNFNQLTETGSAGWRHAVSHGKAQPYDYTKANALKAIFTMDQIALYL